MSLLFDTHFTTFRYSIFYLTCLVAREQAAKVKLGKFSSGIYDDDDIPAGPFGLRTDNNTPSNWKFAILGCGSNAFGQLFVDGKLGKVRRCGYCFHLG